MSNFKKPNIRQLGYEDCRQDIEQDLISVINFLEGDVDREKIVNFIKKYLLKNQLK